MLGLSSLQSGLRPLLHGQRRMIHTVTMFTKKGCSLCVPVKEAILRTQAAFPAKITYKEVDIEVDRTRYMDYRYEIPVVHVDDVEIARHRIDEVAFFKAVEALP